MDPIGFGADDLEDLFSGDMTVEKKPGIAINLKDYICEIAISQKDEYLQIDATLKTNSQMFLNAENIVKAVSSKFSVGDYFIKKIEVYDKNNCVFK
jgi:hypothetical protein